MLKYLLILLLGFTALTGCSKDGCKEERTVCINGNVIWGGPVAADGTGWQIVSSENTAKRYYLKSLPQGFDVEGKAVKVCLQETSERMICNCAGTPPFYYRIISISPN